MNSLCNLRERQRLTAVLIGDEAAKHPFGSFGFAECTEHVIEIAVDQALLSAGAPVAVDRNDSSPLQLISSDLQLGGQDGAVGNQISDELANERGLHG